MHWSWSNLEPNFLTVIYKVLHTCILKYKPMLLSVEELLRSNNSLNVCFTELNRVRLEAARQVEVRNPIRQQITQRVYECNIMENYIT